MATAETGKPVGAFAEPFHITGSMVFTGGIARQECRDQPIARGYFKLFKGTV
ncbi:hypothetical protein [Endozoicomonas sp. ONNA2]|uniref:hypothetical protein n=1 Tax=Endozoicomonas sp. ONNA2 TaxID=2828741 RepID=UPI0021486581|nr:hypothetical protein [Endozoicomonas sp. ONNA2]